ncbi:MAG: O-antigen ligase family protein [Acidimicrobiia bacterium]
MILVVGATAGIVLTYTRTAWIVTLLGLLVVGMFQSRRLVMGLATVAVVTTVAVPSVTGRFADLDVANKPSGATGNSLVWRFEYWGEVLSLVENPATGLGIGMVERSADAEKEPHNDFVRMYAETGILGLLAYC